TAAVRPPASRRLDHAGAHAARMGAGHLTARRPRAPVALVSRGPGAEGLEGLGPSPPCGEVRWGHRPRSLPTVWGGQVGASAQVPYASLVCQAPIKRPIGVSHARDAASYGDSELQNSMPTCEPARMNA